MATRKIQMPGELAQQAPEETTQAQQELQPAATELPALADIDATKLTRAVLTQGGWVCPA